MSERSYNNSLDEKLEDNLLNDKLNVNYSYKEKINNKLHSPQINKISTNNNNINNSSNNNNNNNNNSNNDKPKPAKKTVSFGFGSLTSNAITIDKDTTALKVLQATPGIAIDDGSVISVTGDMSGFLISAYADSDLKPIYEREQMAQDKDAWEKEVRTGLRKEIEENLTDEDTDGKTEEEIKKLVNDKVDEAFTDYSFDDNYDDYFKDWKTGVESDVRVQTKISNGYPFSEFKWIYNTKAKGVNVLDNINLRLSISK